MDILLFLMFTPLVVGVFFLLIPNNTVRDILSKLMAVVISGAAIYLLVANFGLQKPIYFKFDGELVGKIMYGIEALLAVYVFAVSFKNRRYLAAILIILQFGLMSWFEFNGAAKVKAESFLFVDQLSIIMAIIIGVIGTLINLYAVGYMKKHQEHRPEVKDRRNLFFFIIVSYFFIYSFNLFSLKCYPLFLYPQRPGHSGF